MRQRNSTTKRKLQRCKNQPQTPTGVASDLSHEVAITQDKPDVGGGRFFGCYLLTSLSPRFKGHSYIGFTVDPKRRIRQHNGEITSGALRTKKKRPWEMVFCIHGFPTHVSALQFEWAWQHPKESLAVRQAAATFKTLSGLANKIKLALTMLTLPSWHSMDLTVSFFSTKYMQHTVGSPSLPPQMKIHFCPMDELPCYSDASHDINSTHTQDIADMTHDSQVSSVDEVVNASASSIRIERPSTENASKDMWTESSTVEDEQLFPLLPSKEISAQELTQSFHQTSYSDKQVSMHSLLEEEIEPNCQSPGSDMNEQTQLSKEMGTDRFPLVEDLTVPFDQPGPSMGDASSKDTDKFTKKDDTACILIDESIEEQGHSAYNQSPVRVGDNVLPYPVAGIEVIDLFTPSPECRIFSGKKKRRVARDHPDLIDLTRSPVFVQL